MQLHASTRTHNGVGVSHSTSAHSAIMAAALRLARPRQTQCRRHDGAVCTGAVAHPHAIVGAGACMQLHGGCFAVAVAAPRAEVRKPALVLEYFAKLLTNPCI